MEQPSQVFSVSQVNQYIKSVLDGDPLLSGLFVRGEISNYKCYPSGHHYFSLKDAEGTMRCVLFRREAASLRVRPENGMKVVVYGRISAFPRDGQYQLYCSHLSPDGAGELHVAFEQRKEKLQQEGLFNPAHKKPLPPFPARIALVTSPAGAAVRDMIRILGARWPLAEVLVVPVRVQGAEAAGEISAALTWLGENRAADLIITGRGGGSMEDLWAFNEEPVARAIYHCPIPVISAVGHEPDVTIADYVADLRAATPSNAAELAVPDQNELYHRLAQAARVMTQQTALCISRARVRLQAASNHRLLQNPMRYLEERRMELDYLQGKTLGALRLSLGKERERFARLCASLDAMSPLKVLGRGYAIARRPNGTVVRSRQETAPGDVLRVTVTDGDILCEVK